MDDQSYNPNENYQYQYRPNSQPQKPKKPMGKNDFTNAEIAASLTKSVMGKAVK